MFRRPRRPGMGRMIGNLPQLDELSRAHQLLANGQYERAAIMYAQIAGQMEALGRPRQAANLHAQAAHAWVDAGEAQRALNQARLAMNLFLLMRNLNRAAEFKARFTQHLQNRGMQAPALDFEQETNLPAPAQPAAEPQRGRLPATCPQCGAPTRSDSVEWIDARSAECSFCGGTILTID